MASIGNTAMALLVFAAGVNSVHACALISVSLGAYVVWDRRDLAGMSLSNGCLFMLLLFMVYGGLERAFPGVFDACWKMPNLSGVRLGPVPVEELWWAFTWGFVAAPLYEFFTGLCYVPEPHRPRPVRDWALARFGLLRDRP